MATAPWQAHGGNAIGSNALAAGNDDHDNAMAVGGHAAWIIVAAAVLAEAHNPRMMNTITQSPMGRPLAATIPSIVPFIQMMINTVKQSPMSRPLAATPFALTQQRTMPLAAGRANPIGIGKMPLATGRANPIMPLATGRANPIGIGSMPLAGGSTKLIGIMPTMPLAAGRTSAFGRILAAGRTTPTGIMPLAAGRTKPTGNMPLAIGRARARIISNPRRTRTREHRSSHQ